MTREEIEDISCDLLIVDELHHLGAPIWGERVNSLVETHSDMRVFGMSAYSVRDRGTAYERDMVNPGTEELFSDTVVDRYDLYDAIIDGVLPMPFAKSILVENSKIFEDLREVQKIKRIQGTPMYYEIDRVIDGATKTIHRQNPVKEIVQKTVKPDGKYIYFCPVNSSFGTNDIDTIMKEMMGYLSDKYPGKRIVFYKTTSEMGEDGRYNRECFYNDTDLDGIDVSDTIRIMFAKNQYNEGVHAPNIDGVFLGRETGSDIVALEQIGRALSVRGETSKKIEEYNQCSLDEIKEIAKSRGIEFMEDISKEELIELLVSPVIIDLADNVEFLQELETNLKDRAKEKTNRGVTLTKRQVKILETWSTLDIVQRDLYNALMKLRENVQAYTWDEYYELAVSYYKHYGNSEIPHLFKTINGYDYNENGINLGYWCANQRDKDTKLSEERIRKLEEIEFRFERNIKDINWQKIYNLAMSYYKHYGNSEIPGSFKTKNGIDYDENGIALGGWCIKQRARVKNLSPERIKKLELINFRFETQNIKNLWDERYDLVVAYYKHYGNSDIPRKFKTKNGIDYDENGIAIGEWCNRQRNIQKELSEEKIKKLDAIGFRFANKNTIIAWEEWYQLALTYYKHYGNSDIPGKFKTKNGIDYDKNGIAIGEWCSRQRQNQKELSEERIKKLKEINFRFESNARELQWGKMYQLALAYFKHYGNSEIPQGFKTKNGVDYDENGENLGSWCDTVRASIDKKSEKQIKELEAINFRFERNARDLQWGKMYQLALAYFKHYGNSEIPGDFKTKNGIDYDENGENLGNWCRTVRASIDKKSEEQIKKLEAINFRFKNNSRELKWEKMYQLALAYYKHYGNSEIPKNFKTKNGIDYDENGENLGYWNDYHRDKSIVLNEEKTKKLETIEFRFNTKKEIEENKNNLCIEYGIEYSKYKILKQMSYQEMYAKIMYLLDNGYSLLDGDKLHEIFSISNENMVLKYMISKEELITNYYINKKGKGV